MRVVGSVPASGDLPAGDSAHDRRDRLDGPIEFDRDVPLDAVVSILPDPRHQVPSRALLPSGPDESRAGERDGLITGRLRHRPAEVQAVDVLAREDQKTEAQAGEGDRGLRKVERELFEG